MANLETDGQFEHPGSGDLAHVDRSEIRSADHLPRTTYLNAFKKLDPELQVILHLVEVQGLSYQEIAEAINAEKRSRGDSSEPMTRQDVIQKVFEARKQLQIEVLHNGNPSSDIEPLIIEE